MAKSAQGKMKKALIVLVLAAATIGVVALAIGGSGESNAARPLTEAQMTKAMAGGEGGCPYTAKMEAEAAHGEAMPEGHGSFAHMGSGEEGGCPHERDGEDSGKEGDCPHQKDGECEHKDGDCPHKKEGSCDNCEHQEDCPHKKDGECENKEGDCPHKDKGSDSKDGDCPHKKDGECGDCPEKSDCPHHGDKDKEEQSSMEPGTDCNPELECSLKDLTGEELEPENTPCPCGAH